MNRPGRKRLAIDIPERLHEEIKKQAKDHNKTMTRWVVTATIARLRLERANYEIKLEET